MRQFFIVPCVTHSPYLHRFWSSAPSAGFSSHRRSQIISDLRSIAPQRRSLSKILKNGSTGGRLLPRGGSKWGVQGRMNAWPELKEKGAHPKCQSHHLDRNMDYCGPRSPSLTRTPPAVVAKSSSFHRTNPDSYITHWPFQGSVRGR